MGKEYESDEVVVLRREHALMSKQLATYEKIIGSFRAASKRSKQIRQLANARGNIRQMHQIIKSQKQTIHAMEEALVSLDPMGIKYSVDWWSRRRIERRNRLTGDTSA